MIGAVRTRTRAKRERSGSAEPSRHVMVRQACFRQAERQRLGAHALIQIGHGTYFDGRQALQGNESRLTRLCLQWAESVQQVLRVPGGALAAALD